MLDAAIIGGGPAALTAAIYLARAGRQVCVYERGEIGGAITQTEHIANYPGFEGAGRELAQVLRRQAEQARAQLAYGECTAIRRCEVGGAAAFELTIDDEPVQARNVLIATGSEPRPLGFDITPPVSYCALCDADLAKGKHIAVIGGANGAVKESIYLAQLVKDLTIISHSPLKADQVLIDQLRDCSNVTVQEGIEPTPELLNQFEYIFVFIGKRPATGFLKTLDDQGNLLDAAGYVQVKTNGEHQTVVPGLYVAGDVRSGAVRQIITAAGDGAAAATEMIAALAGQSK